MAFTEWAHTSKALDRLRQSLNCGICSDLLQEPCTLGSCDHLFCRSCVADHVGNTCPACHVTAWAKELQVKRELANVVKLYNKMCRLIDPNHNNVPASDVAEPEKEASQDEAMHDDDSADPSGLQGDNQGLQDDYQHGGSEEIKIGDKTEVEGSQQFFTQQHHVKKVVKTVVGKHGKLSCIVKFVDENEENVKASIKKRVKTPARCKSKSRTQSFKQSNSTSSECTTDSSDQGSVEENIYDFIASPSRPKPVKKRTRIVDPKVLRARRVAAANKKWSKSSKFTKSGKQKRKGCGGVRHVSFVEDTDSDAMRKAAELSACSVESMDTGSDSMWDDVDTEDDTVDESQISQADVEQTSVSTSKSLLSDSRNVAEHTPGPGGDVGIASTETKRKVSPAGKKARHSLSPSAGKENMSGRRDSKGLSPGKQAKRNIRGETPLHIAAIKGDAAEVENLLKDGADPNIKDNAGWMPLHEACNHGHTACVVLLLDHGALINAPGFEHDSPLHDAVTNNRVDVVKLLVERGASLKLRNMHGLTPGDYAKTDELKAALSTKPQVTSSPMTALKVHPSTDQPPVFLTTGLNKSQRTKLDSCSKLLKGRVVNEFRPDITHLVAGCTAEGVCMRTIKYLQAILTGKWVVNFTWVMECLKKKHRVDERPHEIPGTTADPISRGPNRGRENTLNQLPGLFDGCNFFFYGTFKPSPSKNELIDLVKSGGGAIVQRQPKPDDDVIQVSTTVPYHVNQDSQLSNCSYFIIYDEVTTRVPPKVNTGKVCTATVSWLMDCISNFALIELYK
ncbi:BRCA1-associated RING domain protein 1-like [Amphiura filiformis]|uniref:BRCA1-associated RING domain protein 1-like n=1 Tax=Amphiura filiformis TaxID=82378 RepID=UPI003B220537